MEVLSPIKLLSSLLFVNFYCRDPEVDTDKMQISDCLINSDVTSWTVAGSCNFRFHLSLLKDRPVRHKSCVWHRTYYNETVITPLTSTITMSDTSVDGQHYINGTCSFSSFLGSNRLLGRSSFVMAIAFVEHRLEKEIVIEEPLAPVNDCPHNVTQGDFVMCHCRPNPAAPGRPPATVAWRDLPVGIPLVVSNFNTSHTNVVYQCQLLWGDPEEPLILTLNHTFRLASHEKLKTADYKRNIQPNPIAYILLALVCVQFSIHQLLGSELKVRDSLRLTEGLACLLWLLLALPAFICVVLNILWRILCGVLYLSYLIICGLYGLVFWFGRMVVAVKAFAWKCLFYVFCFVTTLYVIAHDVGLTICKAWQRLVSLQVRVSAIFFLKQFVSETWLDLCAEPPRYWKVFHDYPATNIVVGQESSVSLCVELSPSDTEYEAVEDLMYGTWEASHTGLGKDAKNLSHKHIRVLSIERIENLKVWEKYNHKRSKMTKKVSNSAKSMEMLFKCTKHVSTSYADKALTCHLNNQANEYYLFHGTKEETLFEITRDGLDMRYAGNGLLGRGLYFAESSTKSDQYTDAKYKRSQGNLVMLLVRVLMGDVYVSNNPNPPKYVRPPCSRCQQTRCQCPESAHYDSVIDDAGRLFREFVIYDSSQCYPEYIIRYQRTHEPPPVV